MRIVLIFSGLLLVIFSYAQSFSDECEYIPPEEANYWYFSSFAGLVFTNSVSYDNANTVLYYNPIEKIGGRSSSVISDELGNFKFVSNGQQVWGSNFELLPHGNDLFGDPSCTQSSIFIQNPEIKNIYYLFTVDFPYDPYFHTVSYGFRYSEIDLNFNPPYGDVKNYNILLHEDVAEKLTAVRHKNERDVWVITHGYDVSLNGEWANCFYVFLVTRDGVDTNFITNPIGKSYEGSLGFPIPNISTGYMKSSPDGSKIAVAITGLNSVEIFDFNNETGVLSNCKSSPETFKNAFGIEFSPDNSKLYVSTLDFSQTLIDSSRVYQLDLNNTDIFQNPYQIIASHYDSAFGALQLGKDGKIYVARTNLSYLSVIQNPDRIGNWCNIIENGQGLGGRSGYICLPNFMQSYLDIPAFTYKNKCFGDTTILTVTNDSNIESQLWNFDDLGSGSSNTSSLSSPGHVFSNPGPYNVLLSEFYKGKSFQSSEKVVINPLPDIDYLNPDTVFLYPGAKFTLQGGAGYDKYFWYYQSMQNPAGTNQQFIAADTGTYYLMVVDTLCCYNIDTIVIIPSVIFVPNAFTPNGDGLNEEFMAICLKEGGINDFHMMVYNRWGQLLFESHEIDEGWDGTLNNTLLPSGVYIYKITYKVELDFGVFDNVVLKGPLTLLR
ncbi:MAG: gliding motility-associated C-terminal domain-containing protein [Bacteroidetes bacterium]|nr:gliding motility-associated C-terminal domain-containing protein [Bacteroidota bacterium]